MEIIYGKHAVGAALIAARRKPKKLFVSVNIQSSIHLPAGTFSLRDGKLCLPNRKETVPIQVCTKQHLDSLTSNVVHQGIALAASRYPLQPWSHPVLKQLSDQVTQSPKSFGLSVLACGVQDPANLGSILRSSYCLGIKHVYLSERKTAKLTPTVCKISAGASELLDIFSVQDESSFLAHLHDLNILCLAATPEPISSVIPHFQTDCLFMGSNALIHRTLKPSGVMLVVGNEENGIPEKICRACAGSISVTQARDSVVDSLNVGVATGILLSGLRYALSQV